LEFGNTGLSKEQCIIRTSFEAAADAMAGALGCQSVFAADSPFEIVCDSIEQRIEGWAYGVSLLCHVLWKLAGPSGNQLMQASITLEDKYIHPDPIKRRFNIEAFVRVLDDPSTAEGEARNKLVAEYFNRGLAKEYEATKHTSLHVEYNPEHILSFMRDQFHKQKYGGGAFATADDQTLMRDPKDWISELHRVSEMIQPDVTKAEHEFRQIFLSV
jgi:hypothetical protein